MFKALLCSFALCSAMLGQTASASASNPVSQQPVPFDRPVTFEPNVGQAPSQVLWSARGSGYQLFLTSSGASIVLAEPLPQSPSANSSSLTARPAPRPTAMPKARVSVVGMNLSGSHAWSNVRGLEPTGGVSNYLFGRDRKNWHSNIPQYARLRVDGVYDGIDLVFYGQGRDLEYDFVVAPGADPTQIRLAFEGASHMRVDNKTGDLMITTSTGSEMRHVRPKVYQQIGHQKVEVAGGYQIMDNGQAAFLLAPYDRRSSLVVDPTVEFTTFFQGNNQDYPTGVAVDASGNSYVFGQTFSTNFPVSAGSKQISKNCTNNVCPPDMFVTKLSPTGQVVYSTFVGGSDVDVPSGIAVDSTGVWITGTTTSRDFSTNTQYAFGYWNAFVAKLSLDLTELDWCVTFGGGGDQSTFNTSNAIALDSKHAAYVAGETFSVDFPTSKYFSTTLQPKQKAFGGASDAFVVKVDPSGSLDDGYSTYLGGSNTDFASGIAVDSSGSAYVTGTTFSKNFPTNAEPSYGSVANAGYIAFVTKLAPDGSSSVYSITLGGTKNAVGSFPLDQGSAIVVNSSNEVYITGDTCSSDFPTFSYSYQQQPPTPCLSATNTSQFDKSAFVTQLSHFGTLLFSTYLGGTNGTVSGNSISLNAAGDVYVGGSTSTSIFPGAPKIALNPTAGFLTKMSSTLQFLKSTTFLGASITNVVVQKPTSRLGIISPPTSTTIYTAGVRYRPNSQIVDSSLDAFVVKLTDPVVIVAQP
jgi:Beta-propeller repeat